MPEENNQPDDIDEPEEEGGDDLCDEKTELEEDEITRDDELPAATGGVEE